MKGTSNLSFGFLFLYDWVPIMTQLDGEEFKALFKALLERQKDGKPMPSFDNPLTQMIANMIEPAIKRRLSGQKGGLKTQERSRGVNPFEETQDEDDEEDDEIYEESDEDYDVREELLKILGKGGSKDPCKDLPKHTSGVRKEKRSEEKKRIAISPSGAETLPKQYGAPAGARKTQKGENFGTDAFFAAALRRTYGDDILAICDGDDDRDTT